MMHYQVPKKWRENYRRVLVVDNVTAMRHVLAQLLGAQGYEVEVAANAEEAMQMLECVRWDGVVVDIDRPEMNGIELYARILALYGPVRLPVIFLSCYPNEMLRIGLHSAPWARLVHKPCTFAQLLEALQGCFGSAGGAEPKAAGG